MAGYRTSGGNYYDQQGGYVSGATFKFDDLGRIVGGIGPNGEQLDSNGRIVGFDYSNLAGSPYASNQARGFNPSGGTAQASIAGAGTSGAVPLSGGTAANGQPADVAANRAAMFAALAPGQGYFGSPLGQQAQGAISSTLAGQNVPYTQGVQDRLFGQAADLNAGSRASQDDLIRRSLAERGMEGSGGGLAAMLGAGRDQSAANSRALSSIQNTATLENFAAQERARQQAESFLSSRSSAEAPYRLKEADLRAQSDKTEQDPFASALMTLFGLDKAKKTPTQAQQGGALGLDLSKIGGRSTVGPGSGSNMGVSAGGTPTQVPQVGALSQQARQATQAVQGYNANPNNFRAPGSHSGYVPRMSPTESGLNATNQIAQGAQKIWYGTNLGGMFG